MHHLGTILGIWAHPDDESFLTSGLMAHTASSGGRVVVVCATRGEAGSQDAERWPPEKMGHVRERELMNALEVLGVTELRWLGYIDGTCEDVDEDEATAKVAAIIQEVQPDTVLTFGPKGETGHPDHIAVHRWATAAFERAAPGGSSLCYATSTPEWAERWCPVFEPYNVFAPGTPEITPASELAIDFELSDELLELKMKALHAQPSQTDAIYAMFGEDMMRESHRRETFVLAMKR